MLIHKKALSNNTFKKSEWEFYEDNGTTFLTHYKGFGPKVVFPKGDNFCVVQFFDWGPSWKTIEEIDFNHIKMLDTSSMRFCDDVRVVKNLNNDITNLRSTFSNNTCIESVELPSNLKSAINLFSRSYIRTPVPLPDSLMYIDGIYEDCALLKTPGKIPNNVVVAHQAFCRSGIFQGADFSATNAEDMTYCYSEAFNLESSGEFSPHTKRFEFIFRNCLKLKKVSDLPESALSLIGAFGGCRQLREQPDLPENTFLADHCFDCCIALRYAKKLPSNLRSAEGMYNDCIKLIKGTDITDSVISTAGMYRNCIKMERGVKIGHSVINASRMYSGCKALIYSPDLPDNIKFANAMFFGCRLKKAPKIGKVVSMSEMFSNCLKLETAPIIPETVENMDMAFYGDENLRGDIIIKSKNITSAKEVFGKIGVHKFKYTKNIYLDLKSQTAVAFAPMMSREKQLAYNIKFISLDKLENYND